MRKFSEWLQLREISSNLLLRAANAAARRGDLKGQRLRPRFIQGAEKSAEKARESGVRAGSWVSGGVPANHPNSRLIPDYSAIRYVDGNGEEGSFVIRTIRYDPSYSSWFQKERGAAWKRTRGEDGAYNKPEGVSGRMPDFRSLYHIMTTKNELITLDGMAEAATMWQMGEAPRQKKWDDRLQVKLDGKDIFPDRNGAMELARQINKYDYEQVLARAPSHSLFKKVKVPSEFGGIKPEFIKQA